MSSALDGPKVSVVWITHRDDPALPASVASVVEQDHRPLELVVFGNGRAVQDLTVPDEPGLTLRLASADENLGVARGRNAAARLATGEFLVFLDDHVVLRPGSIRRAIAAAESSPDVAAVAFRIVDPESGAPRLWYYPQDPHEWGGRPFEASNLVGGGHMLRRERFEEVGRLWDGFFFGEEEIDLSWRLLDAGWTILYEPGAAIEHPERLRRSRHSLSSNLLMYWRLLPTGPALRQTLFLVGLTAIRAVRYGEPGALFGGLRDALALAPRAFRTRSPLRRETVDYLRKANACQSAGKRLQWSLRPLPPPPPFGGQPARST